jgi:hypothetical protein
MWTASNLFHRKDKDLLSLVRAGARQEVHGGGNGLPGAGATKEGRACR